MGDFSSCQRETGVKLGSFSRVCVFVCLCVCVRVCACCTCVCFALKTVSSVCQVLCMITIDIIRVAVLAVLLHQTFILYDAFTFGVSLSSTIYYFADEPLTNCVLTGE